MKTEVLHALKKSSYWLSVAALGIILGLSIQFTKAWTEPTATAPNGNIGAPINTSDVPQRKFGVLGVQGFRSYSTTYLASDGGNVGIGTTDPGYKLHVVGEAYIAPSASGRYHFTSSSTSGYTTTFNMDNTALSIGHNSASRALNLRTGNANRLTIAGNGNVGIGTNPSSERLNVSGNARVSGSVNATSFCNASGGNCVNSLRNTTVYSINPACVDGGKLTLKSTCNAIDGACSDYGTVCYNCTRMSKNITRCNNSVAGYLTR